MERIALMADEVKIEVKGMKELQRKHEAALREMKGGLVFDAVTKSMMLVQRSAKINAPVDTGRLRASITPTVKVVGEGNVQGIVGSNVEYAPYMELGTDPHWPPPGALDVWARRHGIASGFIVARAISIKGIAARKFLERAVLRNMDVIGKIFNRASDRIVRKYR